MKVTVIGLGLIGGSIARDLKSQINISVFGVDNNRLHQEIAMNRSLVNEMVSLEEGIIIADVIIIAVPVDVIEKILPEVLNKIEVSQVVIDVGSTKGFITEAVKSHPRRNRFVAAHPLAGTEFSGPEAAEKGLFVNRKNIICEHHLSDEDAIHTALKVFESLGLQTFYLSPEEHDKHLAYVSHLSHVTSFALSNTVLDIEKDEKQILNLAGTGFSSTVRLAKSSPTTWAAIFNKNKEFLSEALEIYINKLQDYKEKIEAGDIQNLQLLMQESNEIISILKK